METQAEDDQMALQALEDGGVSSADVGSYEKSDTKVRLENRLRRLNYDDLVDWVGERTATRAWNYRARVLEVCNLPDGYAGRVKGTEPYVTKLTIDAYGEYVSQCSCPVGDNCKHAGALALVVSEKLKADLPTGDEQSDALRDELAKVSGKRRKESRPPSGPPSPPPPREVCVTVTENPFGRFTSKGGRHASDFSFRVVVGEKTYHWSFIISTLAYSLAKHGLTFDRNGSNWYDFPSENDPPLFTCSCGVLECGGFGSQFCTYSDSTVEWVVEHCGERIRFVFERVSYEIWAMQALWRMRGGRKLRVDPWEYLTDLADFKTAVSALLSASARCRAIWRMLEAKRRLSEDDRDEIGRIVDESAAVDVREFSGRIFSTATLDDLRRSEPRADEVRRVEERLRSARPEHLGCFVYLPVYAPNWRPTEIKTGDKVVFCRVTDGKSGEASIRVVSENRGVGIGRLLKEDARWISLMMDRHGMVLNGHLEPVRRYGKGLLVRADLSFAPKRAARFDWGDALEPENRLYFEMIRAVALRLKEYPVALIQQEIERLRSVLCTAMSCPEVAFLFAVVTATAREIEARMTDEEVARRLEKCARVRLAMECRPAGEMLTYEGLDVLPLVASGALATDLPDGVSEGARNFIRLSWNGDPYPRVKVELPNFPADATGFAVFRRGEFLDLCLTGVPIADAGLFDNLAIYAQELKEDAGCERMDGDTAYARIRMFLDELPIREPDKDSGEMRYWQERGIHDGNVELDDQDRLVSLRIVMRSARRQWCD